MVKQVFGLEERAHYQALRAWKLSDRRRDLTSIEHAPAGTAGLKRHSNLTYAGVRIGGFSVGFAAIDRGSGPPRHPSLARDKVAFGPAND